MTDSPQDKFEELFRMQQALNERIGVRTTGMSEEEQTKWLLNYTRAMSQEMAELIDSVPWKWWAKYQKFDAQNARVEVVDLFHFLISMAQGPRHVGRRRLQRLREEERSQLQAPGHRLRSQGPRRLEAYLT